MTSQNIYAMPKGFLLSPFDVLYHMSDEYDSDDRPRDCVIEELLEHAVYLNNLIEGEFDMKWVKLEYRQNLFAFVRNGLLIFKVKALKAYKHTHANFKVFCKEILKISHWQANRYVEASRVVLELVAAGYRVLPKNPAQCAPLSCFTGEELIEKWQEVLDNIPEDLITAKSINNLLNPPEFKEKTETTIKLPPKLYLRIMEEAISKDLSVSGLLAQIFLPKGANLHPHAKEDTDKNNNSG